jgi:hypothetical protein
MKLTASRLKQLIAKELRNIKEGMDPMDQMKMNPDYRPIDDVEDDMSAPSMNPHQEDHDRKMKEDPSYREWFMSLSQAKPVNVPGEDFSDYDLPPNL